MFYLDLFRSLDRHRVGYLLVGGLAMNLHGVPRMTMDVDIVLAMDGDAGAANAPTLDVLLVHPLDTGQALARAEHRLVGDIPVKLAAIEDMVSLKQAAGRRQDLDDIDNLLRLRNGI